MIIMSMQWIEEEQTLMIQCIARLNITFVEESFATKA